MTHPAGPTIHVAIPIQDEVGHLPLCLDALRQQERVRFIVWSCVNQPDAWQNDPDRRSVCEANQVCLRMLSGARDLNVRIIDRASPGRGWPPKRSGVGHARKELFDAISDEAAPQDLIVSLDADTIVAPRLPGVPDCGVPAASICLCHSRSLLSSTDR